jgi:hypothetical protein
VIQGHHYLDALRASLDATGLPWTAEIIGERVRVQLDGQHLLTLPRLSFVKPDKVTLANTQARIRRKARSLRK